MYCQVGPFMRKTEIRDFVIKILLLSPLMTPLSSPRNLYQFESFQQQISQSPKCHGLQLWANERSHIARCTQLRIQGLLIQEPTHAITKFLPWVSTSDCCFLIIKWLQKEGFIFLQRAIESKNKGTFSSPCLLYRWRKHLLEASQEMFPRVFLATAGLLVTS